MGVAPHLNLSLNLNRLHCFFASVVVAGLAAGAVAQAAVPEAGVAALLAQGSLAVANGYLIAVL